MIRELNRLDWFNRASVVYLLLVVPLYWNFEAFDTTLWEKFLVAHIIAIRMAAGWFASSWEGHERPGRYFLDLPILLYLALASLSWLSAINPLKSCMEVIRILLGATIYFSVSRTYKAEFRDVWLGAVSISLAAVSIIGIVQYLGLGFLDWRSAGLPSATFFYRNYAAMFVALGLPLAFCGFTLANDRARQGLYAIATTVGGIFLIYTRTRGAWLGVGLGAIVVIVALRAYGQESRGWKAWVQALKNRGKILSACGLLLVCFSLLAPSRKTELQTIPHSKTSAVQAFVSILAGQGSGRTAAWLQSVGMIVDHPLTGVGIGNWDAEFLRYAGPAFMQDGRVFGRPHNDYLWVLSETGIPGLVLFIWIFGGGMWLVWRRIQESDDDEILMLSTALGAGILAISIHAFFSFPRERMTATVLPFLMLGWIVALDRNSGSGGSDGSGSHRLSWRPALLLVLSLVALRPTIDVVQSFRAYFWSDAFQTFDRNEEALFAIDGAISHGVPDYRIVEHKAFLHHKMGDSEAALAASELLLTYHPYNAWNFHKIGMFNLELGRYEAARSALLQGIVYAPNLGWLHRELGQAYEGLGNPDGAIEAYRDAMKIMPHDAYLLTKLASLLVEQGDVQEAREHILAAAIRLKLTEVHADAAEIGRVALRAGAYDTALIAYGRAAALAPEVNLYQEGLAHAYTGVGDYAQAVAVLNLLADRVKEDVKQLLLDQIQELESMNNGDG
jgi:O-antigen ligase/tetratricopeptide (TPR) repeat protein